MAEENYYIKLGIETEAERYEEKYNDALVRGDWIAQKVIIGNYEETIENAKRFLEKNSEFIGELEEKLERMETKKQWRKMG